MYIAELFFFCIFFFHRWSDCKWISERKRDSFNKFVLWSGWKLCIAKILQSLIPTWKKYSLCSKETYISKKKMKKKMKNWGATTKELQIYVLIPDWNFTRKKIFFFKQKINHYIFIDFCYDYHFFCTFFFLIIII